VPSWQSLPLCSLSLSQSSLWWVDVEEGEHTAARAIMDDDRQRHSHFIAAGTPIRPRHAHLPLSLTTTR
jgi:hypothetical protein